MPPIRVQGGLINSEYADGTALYVEDEESSLES